MILNKKAQSLLPCPSMFICHMQQIVQKNHYIIFVYPYCIAHPKNPNPSKTIQIQTLQNCTNRPPSNYHNLDYLLSSWTHVHIHTQKGSPVSASYTMSSWFFIMKTWLTNNSRSSIILICNSFIFSFIVWEQQCIFRLFYISRSIVL